MKKRKPTARASETNSTDAQARALLRYMDQSTPDWLLSVIVHAIEEAGRLTRFPVPTWSTEETTQQRVKMLSDLFSQSPRIDLTSGAYRVRRALYELLHNPDTPPALHERCGQFVCDQSNERNVFHSDTVLAEVLKTVPPDQLRGAIERTEARSI